MQFRILETNDQELLQSFESSEEARQNCRIRICIVSIFPPATFI